MKKLIFLIPALYAFAGFSQVCHYLAYDACYYQEAVPVDGLSGGTGWSGAWEVQNDNTTVPGYQASNTSLAYPALRTIGNKLAGGSAFTSMGRRLNLAPAGPFQDYLSPATGMIGRQGTSLYWSILLQKNNNNNEPVQAMLQGNNVPWVINQHPRAAVGYFGVDSHSGGLRYWSVDLNGVIHRSTHLVVPGVPVLFVMRIDFNSSGHTVTTWINPPTIGESNPLPDLTNTVNGSFEFSSIALYLGDGAGAGYADEIRVGREFRCVAPTSSVPLNTPPEAVIDANFIDGTAPFVVWFDGSRSLDFDGHIVSAVWNFMDGTLPIRATGVSHTFFELGEFDVSLTVTDNAGLQHTTYRRITVRGPDGNFSCGTSIRLLNKASCGAADGSLMVNTRFGANLSLRNSSNQEITVADPNRNIYRNLAAGNYTLYVHQPAAGCRDTFALAVHTDSTTCASWQPPTCLKMGINLDYLNFYGAERPFKNIFRYASDWITYNVSSATPWDPWDSNVANQVPTDANGYPEEVPFNTTIGPQGVRSSLSANGSIRPGEYLLLYDGEGEVQLNGVTIDVNTAHRIEFTVPENYTGNIWINIARSQRGNNVRNIRVIRRADEATYLEQPYHQPFLDRIAPFHCIRFGEWGNLNTGTFLPEYFDERALPTYFTQASVRGVSYEDMIDLCNATRKDVWIGVPHTAYEDYITQMADLFRRRLHPDLKVYVEYSNEVWNWFFAQAHYVRDYSPQNISHARKYARYARRTFEIWHRVWGTQAHRVKRVLNTQISNYPFGEEMMAELKQDGFDYLSPSWYFGYTGSGCAGLFNGATTPEEVINCTRDFFRQGFPAMKQDYLNASLYNKGVINYEGGQHMTDGTMTPYINAVWDAQVHPDIYNLYNEVLDSLKRLGPELTNAYNLARFRRTPYGSFGHLEHIDEVPDMNNAPKWMALMRNACPPTSLLPIPPDPDDPADPGPLPREGKFRVIPNPFTSTISIDSICLQCSYRMFDAKGRLVFTGNDLNGNFSSLPSGMYVLFIYDNRGQRISSHKLIKQ